MCPVCGYPDLNENPTDPSYETCPSCGFEFGYDDDVKHTTFEQWHQQWIAHKMKWYSKGRKMPLSWNPQKQLLNIGVRL